MSESARSRVRGAVGGTIVGIVLVFAGATSADTEIATFAVIGFSGVCGYIFSPLVRQDELADL